MCTPNIFSTNRVGHVPSRGYNPSASHGPQPSDGGGMDLLAGPERAGERFSGLEIRVYSLPPLSGSVLASIRRLASPGPLRRDRFIHQGVMTTDSGDHPKWGKPSSHKKEAYRGFMHQGVMTTEPGDHTAWGTASSHKREAYSGFMHQGVMTTEPGDHPAW